MQISLNTRVATRADIRGINGYGYATLCVLDALEDLGHDVSLNNPEADIGICFDQPQHHFYYPGQYRIAYFPWESTQLQKGWADLLNNADEVWTPSDLIASWMPGMGITRPVYVYEHGIEAVWQPRRRDHDSVHFLHLGAEAARKGGWMLPQVFRSAFPNNEDVTLTLKMVKQDWNGIERLGKVRYLNESMSFGELQNLFYESSAYVYPSSGEGFGLTPIQALATGMPTITVPDWAPYRRFLEPDLNLTTRLVTSPWPSVHPGKVFRISKDDLIDKLRHTYENYDQLHSAALARAGDIHREYDWKNVTNEVFKKLENRLV